jgi:hypothetical protein
VAGALPDEVRRLISRHIDSVAQLDVLLLLQESRERSWTVQEIARQLRQQPDLVEATLARLSRGGIVGVEVNAAGEPAFCFRPGTKALESATERLAATYATHKTSVITAIFSSPSDAIEDFADAFRLRRED